MRLSEAIRLGATMGLKDDPGIWLDREKHCGCALGGAMLAIGHKEEFIYSEDIVTVWPMLSDIVSDPQGFSGRMISIIGSLFRDRWTRERIADWVETLELERGLIEEPAPTTSLTTTSTSKQRSFKHG